MRPTKVDYAEIFVQIKAKCERDDGSVRDVRDRASERFNAELDKKIK
jgi:hypothetical protein